MAYVGGWGCTPPQLQCQNPRWPDGGGVGCPRAFQAFVMTHESLQGVAIEQLQCKSEDKALRQSAGASSGKDVRQSSGPIVLRVVALKDFKVGDLVLTPYNLANPDQLLTKASGDTSTQGDKSKYHSRFYIAVHSKEYRKSKDKIEDKDKKKPKPVKATFYMNSPMDKLKPDDDCDLISPIWALAKTTKPTDVNMVLEVKLFEFPPMIPISTKVPTPIKKALFNVSIQCAVNNRKIRSGETLCLSVMQEDPFGNDDDEDEESE